jgi:RNA polymerase sigma-70 factor (sigma-E family)
VRRDADFSEYVSVRRGRLVHSAVLFGCAPSEAEDVVQNALIRCYRHWERVIGAGDTDAYVYRVLLNCLSDSRQRASRRELPAAEPRQDEAVQETSDAVVSRMVLLEALGKLPEDRRSTLVLRYFADLSERQIAEATNVRVGTVKSRLSRGLAQLSADPQIAGLNGKGVDDAHRR